ncbi:hypothetical protein [Methanoregula sp.]|uniref:hypothetical protein n=1 Tax=Methanoregula sp. TaxID=2052170 RepID=UPI003C75A495
MRSLVEYLGLVGIGVSALVVLVAVVLLILLIGCVALGAYESATNPNVTNDTAREYQQLQSNISTGTAGISGAVRNTTGG